ncbi:hypothetical protein [Lewinella sp. W8]|uniref:hypothetical protein n=1 Tax=Lewinella sp. W8 TaxID=2528208 RepID=UPI001067C4B9|nr:hypothetical protein [Lewinella sp. W8]MTB52742.1 hypothetical protein [Lewinella sp. W8]
MRRFLFLLLLLSLVLPLSAQTSLQFDRPFHVAGEVTWFTAYLAKPAPPKVRVVVYGADGKVTDYFFLKTDDQDRISGHFRFPYGATTSYFRFQLQALTAEDQLVSLGTFRHAVYADKRVEAQTGAATAGTGTMPAAGGLSVSTQNGQLTIAGLNGQAYSLSIVNDDVVPENFSSHLQVATGSATHQWKDTLFYSGTVSDTVGQPIQTNLLPFFDPATYRLFFTKADAAGAFQLELAGFEDVKTIQGHDLNSNDIKVRLTLPELAPLTERPAITDAVVNYIDLSRRRKKIYQLFATVETPLEFSVAEQKRRVLDPNRDFDVQDYKAFPDMYTFFKEVAGELRIRIRKGEYISRLYNAPNQRFFGDTPLFIVDGKLTRNSNYINKMSPAEVEYLSFFYDNGELRRDFPALGNNGVVQIETVRPPANFPAADAEDILTIRGLQPAASFQPRQAEGNVPAVSPLLLWQVGAGGEDSVTLPLPTTDDYGNYRIVVVARDAQGGVRAASSRFEVAVR